MKVLCLNHLAHFEMVRFGESVFFDVSIFYCYASFISCPFQMLKCCRLPPISKLLPLVCYSRSRAHTHTHARNTPYFRKLSAIKACWNIHEIEMRNVTCVHAAAFSHIWNARCFRAKLMDREREREREDERERHIQDGWKPICELMANHQCYIWPRNICKNRPLSPFVLSRTSKQEWSSERMEVGDTRMRGKQ